MADAESPRLPEGEEGRQQGGDGFGASSTSVLDAKLARRKLQQDVELLSNRVERLRQEERKAKQKVLETKLRGQEIAALQKRNEQAAQAKALANRHGVDVFAHGAPLLGLWAGGVLRVRRLLTGQHQPQLP